MDEVLAHDLRSETETILTLAEQAGPLPADHRLMASPAGGDSNLKTRLAMARRHGNFVDAGARRPVSLSAVLAAQRAVAKLHGLCYLSARQQSRWVAAGGADVTAAGGRSRNYLSVLLNDPSRGFPRLDWALIGHAFRVPAKTWEAGDDSYLAWADQAAGGAQLFSRGLAFFDQFATSGGLLRVRPRDSRSTLTVVGGTRQIGTGGEPGMQHVVRGDRVALQINYPPAYSPGPRVQALVLESDVEGNVSLVSRAALVGDDLTCGDGDQIPPAQTQPRPYLFFDTPGVSTLYALVCADGGLDQLDLYRRTRREALGTPAVQPLLGAADLAELRDHWLGADPAGCRVIRTRLEVTA